MTNKQAARKLSRIMHRLSVLRIEADRIRDDIIRNQTGRSERLLTDVNASLTRARSHSELTEADVTDAWHLLYRE